MSMNPPNAPEPSSPDSLSTYALFGAGLVVAIIALVLVLVLSDGEPRNVATVVPTTQPTAPGGDGDGDAGDGDTTAPTTPAEPGPTAAPTAPPTATAVPPTPRPTAAPTPRPTPPTAPPATPTTAPKAYPVASLDITITHPDVAPVEYTVSCNGTHATNECKALARAGVRDRLVNGAPDDRICTEIYGGPDLARIVGVYDGRAVDTTVDRANGCGINDWDVVLAGILRPARGVTPPPTPVSGSARVTGHVLATPTCPVQREGEICPPAPVDGIVEFSQGDRVIATVQTDANGAYAIDLAPGDYAITIDVGNTPFPACESATVRAAAGRTTVADVDCDTGIR